MKSVKSTAILLLECKRIQHPYEEDVDMSFVRLLTAAPQNEYL